MDELLKTQRITIAVLVVIGLLLIGLMVKKAPEAPYSLTAQQMLAKLESASQITPFEARQLVGDSNVTVFIDLRSPYDFEVSHIPGAKNIPTAFLLDDENKELLMGYQNNGVTVVLYGQTERESTAPWMLLQQRGFSNTKLLLGGFNHFNDKGSRFKAGRADYDYAKISVSGALKSSNSAVASKPKPKKVIPIKKKVKKEAEGGC